jgi:hypothetical protein
VAVVFTAETSLSTSTKWLDYIKERSSQHDLEMVTHHHGESNHLAFLERPFVEAIEALQNRMHEKE